MKSFSIFKDKHFKELINGAGIALMLRFLGMGIGYFFAYSVIKLLGIKAWGIFALSLIVLQVSAVVSRLGMDIALLKFTAEYITKGELEQLKKIYKEILYIIIPFSIVVSVATYIISPILSTKIFHKSYLTQHFRVMSFFILPFVLLWIHAEAIRGLKKIKQYMLLQQTGISIIASLFFLMMQNFLKNTFAPIVSYGISITILTIIAVNLFNKYINKLKVTTTNFTSDNISRKHLLKVSIPMLLSSSLFLLMGWIDSIMLGIFKNAEDVGTYYILFKTTMLINIALAAVNTIAAPKYVEFYSKGDRNGLIKIVQRSTIMVTILGFLIFSFLLLFSKEIFEIFKIKKAKSMSVFLILSIGQFIGAIFGSSCYTLQMIGFQSYHQIIMFIGVFVNFILDYLLIPNYGTVGAAFASMISIISWNFLCSFKLNKILRGILLRGNNE